MIRSPEGILSGHQKLVDFLNRWFDIVFLGASLGLTHWWFEKNWGHTSTLLLLLGVVFYQLGAALTGIYASQRSSSTRNQLEHIVIALGGAFILVAMSASLSNRLHSLADRMFLLSWLSWSTLLLCSWRILVRKTLAAFRRHGLNSRKAAIVGAGNLGKALASRFQANPWMGIEVLAFYDDAPKENLPFGIPYAGHIEKLIEEAKDGRYEHVYIALPMRAEARISMLVDELSDSASHVFLIPNVFMFDLLHSRQTTIDGLPAISIYDTPFSLADGLLKRAFDIVGSLVILSIIALPMLAIASAVKFTSAGPAIFRQKRYGLDGKPIEVWKFRTMNTMDNGSMVKQATKNDSRLTPIGGFLRRTSLDELPQFINVLQGQMSIVGPRPHAVAHNEEYRKLIKGYMLRHKVKPGITGWAQINGWRGETDTLEKMEKRVEFDLDYIRNWTVWLDIKIVFLTLFKGFIDKNAY